MRRTISVVAGLVLIIQMSSCTVKKTTRVDAPQVANPASEMIVGITTKAGEDLQFDPPGALVRGRMLDANISKKPYQISIDEVQRFWIEREETSTVRTVGLVAGIVVGTLVVVAIIIAATKESCPFIYSWDGSKYVFDGEPFGGAITRGLERDDYSELDQLRPDNGVYRLLIRNEVPETQFTNLMELVVADHKSDRVAMDDTGKVHTLTSVRAPITAVDETGRNLLGWLAHKDKRILETEPETDLSANVRQDIRITFQKPLAATRAKLVVNGGTSLWGSYMIKAISALRGADMESWYSSMDSDPSSTAALAAWNRREELFELKIFVDEPTGWVQEGSVWGGGPFVLEDRVIELDVSRLKGRELDIRIQPPKGFWAFNSFGVDYDSDEPADLQILHPIEARDSSGRDRLQEIKAVDDLYYDMPNVGDQGTISFKAPGEKPGMKRTVFLHSRGYYHLHMDPRAVADLRTLNSLLITPDAAARFAGLQFAAWQREHRAP